MSHSKHTKRGYSLYIENWNRSAKKYINTCCICGHKGYSPVIEQDDFCTTYEKKRFAQNCQEYFVNWN